MDTKRTSGITVLSLILGWLSLAGFGNYYVMLSNPNYGTPAISYVALAYGCMALLTCIGLWKMKQWAYKSFLLWCAIVIIFGFIYQYSIGGIPLWQFALFLLLIGTIMFTVARYVQRALCVSH